MSMKSLLRIGDEIIDLNGVRSAHLDFDLRGGVAIEFKYPVFGAVGDRYPSGESLFIPDDKRRRQCIRLFYGEIAERLAEIFDLEVTEIDDYMAKREAEISRELYGVHQ